MPDLGEFLRSPAVSSSPASRPAALLGGTETLTFEAVSIGDLIYDRMRIDPRAIEAFNFLDPASEHDIHELASWSHKIIDAELLSYEGHVNQVQGYVFERIAAHTLRGTGAEDVFP